MQVQIPAWRLPVFFFFYLFFLPFGFLLSSLTAGPVSFARFLRKRISSCRNVKLRVHLVRLITS